MQASIVIITPIQEEYAAVRTHLQKVKAYIDKQTDLHYEIGEFEGQKGTHRIAIFQKGKGTVEITLATERAIQSLNPSYIFLVGTAGGLKKVSIGDIVIGTKGYNYESGRELATHFSPTPKVSESSETLISLARTIHHQGHWKKRLLTNAKDFKVVEGPIVSGEKVVETDKTNLYKILRQNYRDAVALEMEAYGFLKTANSYKTAQCLIIRSVSDLLGDKEIANQKGSREVASANAAAFAFELIAQLPSEENRVPLWVLGLLVAIFSALLFINYGYGKFKDIPSTTIETLSDTIFQPPHPQTYPHKKDTIINMPAREIAPPKISKTTFSLNIPLEKKQIIQLEKELRAKFSHRKNPTNSIKIKDNGHYVPNKINDYLQYYSGGQLEIIINGVKCCCTENLKILPSDFPGNPLPTEQEYVKKQKEELIKKHFPLISKLIKDCLL